MILSENSRHLVQQIMLFCRLSTLPPPHKQNHASYKHLRHHVGTAWPVAIQRTPRRWVQTSGADYIWHSAPSTQTAKFWKRGFHLTNLPVKKLLAGNGCLHTCRFANLCSKNACDPSSDALGSQLSNALRIIFLRRILFPRKKFFGKSLPP